MGFYPEFLTVGNAPSPLALVNGGTGVAAASDQAALTALGGMSVQAATAAAGFALQNGTPSIITWTTPNDGNNHRVTVFASLDVSSAETGGAVTVTITDPGGTVGTHTLYAGGAAAGSVAPGIFQMIAKANTAVAVAQGSALTVGAATLYAEIWGL